MRRALGFLVDHGVRIERVMKDNGSCCRSRALAEPLGDAGIAHRRIRSYRPQTNGKVERFNLSLKWEWAYARPYDYERLTHRGTPAMAPSLQLRWSSDGAIRQSSHHGGEQRPEEGHLGDAAHDKGRPEEAPRDIGIREAARLEPGEMVGEELRRGIV